MALANAFLSSEKQFSEERSYPLAVTSCTTCGFVQLTHVVPAEQLYQHYLYVSSTSEAVCRYANALALRLVKRYRLTGSHLVVEIGSNDGLVLREFQRQGVRVSGVEPARNIAAIARGNGVPTIEELFSNDTAARLTSELGHASVILGRHVFAHINDLHDFFRGVAQLLSHDGVLLIEIPYLGNLLEELEFDTIYHEHLSYISVEPLVRICETHGFRLVDAELVTLHGGSMLFAIQRAETRSKPSVRVNEIRDEERKRRLTHPETLAEFANRVARWKHEFEDSVEALKRSGAHLVGYGAAAKANTLLNYCPDVARSLRCVLDRSHHKHGLYTPGTHLPVVDAQAWQANGTSHMLLLAWNFKDEIMDQMRPFAERGGRFVIPIPKPEII